MKIEYSPKFSRMYSKLSPEIKSSAEKKEKIFRANPFDPRLKTHKLSGKLSSYWAFWIDFKNRIIFSFLDEKTVHFHSVGNHDVYK